MAPMSECDCQHGNTDPALITAPSQRKKMPLQYIEEEGIKPCKPLLVAVNFYKIEIPGDQESDGVVGREGSS